MGFTPTSISLQLKEYLPKLTNIFNQQTAVIGTISSGNPQVLTINLPNHGYLTGQYVILTNSLTNNPIIGVNQYTTIEGYGILRFQTQAPHDMICNKTILPPDIDNATLIGFTDVNLNDTFPLYDVSDRYHFDILYPTLPILTGHENLQNYISNGLDGVWPITVIDKNNFSITLIGTMYIVSGTIARLNISWNFRIYPVYDWKSAEALYTKELNQNNPPNVSAAIYLIMGECRAAKDINIQNDAKQANTMNNEQRIKMINTFNLNVVLPTSQSFSAGEAEELCWGDLLFWLVNAMSGVNFPATVNSPYITTLIGHGPIAYNTAYYVHSYEFEYTFEIANVDTFNYNFNESVALRQIDLSLMEPIDNGSYVNLDTGV